MCSDAHSITLSLTINSPMTSLRHLKTTEQLFQYLEFFVSLTGVVETWMFVIKPISSMKSSINLPIVNLYL